MMEALAGELRETKRELRLLMGHVVRTKWSKQQRKPTVLQAKPLMEQTMRDAARSFDAVKMSDFDDWNFKPQPS